MADLSSLILGMLCLAAAIMAYGSRVVMKRQKVSGGSWVTNMPLQLSTAFYLHGLSSIPAFVATLVAGTRPVTDPATYLLWTTWVGWLVAKTMVIRVTGNLELALCSYAMWAVVWAVWRGMIGV